MLQPGRRFSRRQQKSAEYDPKAPITPDSGGEELVMDVSDSSLTTRTTRVSGRGGEVLTVMTQNPDASRPQTEDEQRESRKRARVSYPPSTETSTRQPKAAAPGGDERGWTTSGGYVGRQTAPTTAAAQAAQTTGAAQAAQPQVSPQHHVVQEQGAVTVQVRDQGYGSRVRLLKVGGVPSGRSPLVRARESADEGQLSSESAA